MQPVPTLVPGMVEVHCGRLCSLPVMPVTTGF